MPARKSICKGKSVKNPNRCKKLRGCKVAKGAKRTFCRKKHNRTQNRTSQRYSSATRRARRLKRLNRELKISGKRRVAWHGALVPLL